MRRLRHPRDWPNAAWILVGVLVLVLMFVANRVDIAGPSDATRDLVVQFAPTVGVLVALSSLMITAASAVATWRRQKRQASIEAWTKWSDGNVEARKSLTAHLGLKRISPEQAAALVDRNNRLPLQDQNGQPLSDELRRTLSNDIATLLNGLERMANGVELGVYDATTVRRLGATIIVRTYERFEPYIAERRHMADLDRRQQQAFVALSDLGRVSEGSGGGLRRLVW